MLCSQVSSDRRSELRSLYFQIFCHDGHCDAPEVQRFSAGWKRAVLALQFFGVSRVSHFVGRLFVERQSVTEEISSCHVRFPKGLLGTSY